MSEVFVVTNPELGWDCVVGVFNSDDVSQKILEKTFPDCIIRHQIVHKDVYDFLEEEE